jgi:hypothetical protein
LAADLNGGGRLAHRHRKIFAGDLSDLNFYAGPDHFFESGRDDGDVIDPGIDRGDDEIAIRAGGRLLAGIGGDIGNRHGGRWDDGLVLVIDGAHDAPGFNLGVHRQAGSCPHGDIRQTKLIARPPPRMALSHDTYIAGASAQSRVVAENATF